MLKVEFSKLKRPKVWIIILAVLVTQLAWSFYALNSYSRKNDYLQWEYISYQFGSLNTLIMPVLISVISSRICDIEHKGNCLKLLNTIVTPQKTYNIKLLVSFIYILFIILGQLFCIFISNLFFHFDSELPIEQLIFYIIVTACVSLCILSLQQALSFIIQNQIISLIFGLAGAFIGIMSLYVGGIIMDLSIWSYYGVLCTVFSDWNIESKTLSLNFISLDFKPLILIILIGALFYIVGSYIFVRKEV